PGADGPICAADRNDRPLPDAGALRAVRARRVASADTPVAGEAAAVEIRRVPPEGHPDRRRLGCPPRGPCRAGAGLGSPGRDILQGLSVGMTRRSRMRAFAIAAVLVLVAAPSWAQAPSDNPVSAALKSSWESAKRNIKESAEQMPEDGYGFQPVPAVRTFGAILAHVAGVNYLYCGAAKGDKTPRNEDDVEKAAKTKADIVKALNE